MNLSSDKVAVLLSEQIAAVADARVKARIEELVVVPHAIEGEWDYGKEGQKFTCWLVIEHPESGTGIAYCHEGFGPLCPWGLMDIAGANRYRIGMDCQWYSTLEEAFRDSWAYEALAGGP